MGREFFLQRTDLETAFFEYSKSISNFLNKIETERVSVESSVSRITSCTVYAKRNVPNYNSSAMDGIAVNSFTLFGISSSKPKVLKEYADSQNCVRDEFIYISTGNIMPLGFNSVIMIEDVEVIDEKSVRIREGVTPYLNVRKTGEDICSGEMLFERFHEITPPDIALLLSSGVFEIEVLKRIKVLFLPTGNEIEDPTKIPEIIKNRSEVRIPETNSKMAKAYLSDLCFFDISPIIPDDIEALKEKIHENVEKYDLLLINAGSSAGVRDFTSQAVKETGEVFFHGINIKPGKPCILGLVKDIPVIGLPGYPGSCMIILEKIVRPLILERNRIFAKSGFSHTKAILSKRITASGTGKVFIKANCGYIENDLRVFPLKSGAANLSSLSGQDCEIEIPDGTQILEEGEKVNILLRKSRREIENKVIISGSHDILIDILKDMLKEKNWKAGVAVSNIGSLGGIINWKKNFCHLCPTHILDPESGEYNIPIIKKFSENFTLVNLSFRDQGLIVQKGNPKNIKSLEDLIRDDVVFINRQKSAGTRILLDFMLKENNLDSASIKGYSDEEYSHVNLSQKILLGEADTGLGIFAAARMYGLDFVPLYKERFDLLVNPFFEKSRVFEDILEIIKSKEFILKAEELGGYEMKDTGKFLHRYSDD